MEVPRKRRKLSFYPPQQLVLIVWNSPYNNKRKVTISATDQSLVMVPRAEYI